MQSVTFFFFFTQHGLPNYSHSLAEVGLLQKMAKLTSTAHFQSQKYSGIFGVEFLSPSSRN